MEKLAEDTASTVRKGSHVTLLLAPFYDEKVTGRFLDLTLTCLPLFLKTGVDADSEDSHTDDFGDKERPRRRIRQEKKASYWI